jgi:hypothetical protein
LDDIQVTAQAEAFAVENSAKKVCRWGARPTCTPFLRNFPLFRKPVSEEQEKAGENEKDLE